MAAGFIHPSIKRKGLRWNGFWLYGILKAIVLQWSFLSLSTRKKFFFIFQKTYSLLLNARTSPLFLKAIKMKKKFEGLEINPSSPPAREKEVIVLLRNPLKFSRLPFLLSLAFSAGFFIAELLFLHFLIHKQWNLASLSLPRAQWGSR